MTPQVTYSDRELLDKIAAGEEPAFREVFDRFRDRLFGYILSITHNHHGAEEITQELFIKLWTSRDLLGEVDRIEPYLFVMARFRTISWLRTALRSEEHRLQLQSVMNRLPSPDTAGAETKLIEEEYARHLASAISNLSPQRQKVFRLSREEGFRLEAIAEQMNLSRSTVKNHLSLAVRQIREELSRHGIGVLLLYSVLHT